IRTTSSESVPPGTFNSVRVPASDAAEYSKFVTFPTPALALSSMSAIPRRAILPTMVCSPCPRVRLFASLGYHIHQSPRHHHHVGHLPAVHNLSHLLVAHGQRLCVGLGKPGRA